MAGCRLEEGLERVTGRFAKHLRNALPGFVGFARIRLKVKKLGTGHLSGPVPKETQY